MFVVSASYFFFLFLLPMFVPGLLGLPLGGATGVLGPIGPLTCAFAFPGIYCRAFCVFWNFAISLGYDVRYQYRIQPSRPISASPTR